MSSHALPLVTPQGNCIGERNFRFFVAYLVITALLQAMGILFAGGALWASMRGSDEERQAGAEQALGEARGFPAGALISAMLALRALASAVARAPGTGALLAYCFATFTGVAPMAVHYVFLTAMDYTAKDVAAQRRGGVSAGRGMAEGARGVARNCAAALLGPLPPSRVWPRRGAAQGAGQGASRGDAAERGQAMTGTLGAEALTPVAEPRGGAPSPRMSASAFTLEDEE